MQRPFGKRQNVIIAAGLDKSLPEYEWSLIGETFWMDWDFQATYNQLLETLFEIIQKPRGHFCCSALPFPFQIVYLQEPIKP